MKTTYIWTRENGLEKVYPWDYLIHRFGVDNVHKWLKEMTPEMLFDCMDAFSSDSFVDGGQKHREKDLNILEMILQETPEGLYRSVTYGVCPGATCTDAIGSVTGRKKDNVEIAIWMIQIKIHDIKEWLLENYNFSDREKRLLHYFKDNDSENNMCDSCAGFCEPHDSYCPRQD